MRTLRESLFDVEDIAQSELDRAAIAAWLKKNAQINGDFDIHDGVVDVKGSIIIYKNIEGFRLGKVSSSVTFVGVTSLEGSPDEYMYYFIEDSNLDDLTGMKISTSRLIPGVYIKIDNCNISSMTGIVGRVKNIILENSNIHDMSALRNETIPYWRIINTNIKDLSFISNSKKIINVSIEQCNNITSLKGISDIDGILTLSKCKNLKSLKGLRTCDHLEVIMCPIKNLEGTEDVLGSISIDMCPITSLEGSPRNIDNMRISYCNELKNLKGSPDNVTQAFTIDNVPLESLDGISGYINVLDINKIYHSMIPKDVVVKKLMY